MNNIYIEELLPLLNTVLRYIYNINPENIQYSQLQLLPLKSTPIIPTSLENRPKIEGDHFFQLIF